MFGQSIFFRIFTENINNMALYREQLEPYMYSEKRRKRKSYKWAKKQMNKWLRIKNNKIGDDEVGGHGKKQWYGWEW